MKFNKETFISTNLSPSAFMLLYAILEDDKTLQSHLNYNIIEVDKSLIELQKNGYLKLLFNSDKGLKIDEIQLRKKALDLKEADKESPKQRANVLLIPFREIFPTGTNQGGYRYRGDKQGCLEKLEKFIKDNPEWTNQQILDATQRYVNRFKPTYQGMRQAHYFIKKDKLSDLSGELEGLLETPKVEKKKSLNKMI